MADLIADDQLPAGFAYPREFIRVVELGLTNLEPWWIIDGVLLRERYHGLSSRYPERSLVPFAVRVDCDDVACWVALSREVVIVHDFADVGYEGRAQFPDFYSWLRAAVEDLIEFGG